MRTPMLLLVSAFIAMIGPLSVTASPLFEAPSYLIGTPGHPSSVALADVDGNGQADVIVAFSDGGMAIARATGGGFVSPFQSFYSSHSLSNVLAADVDGDGKVDIIGSGSPGGVQRTVVVGFGDGQGGCADSFIVEMRRPGQFGVAGDLDQDGRADFVYLDADTDSIEVWRGNADRTLTRTAAIGLVSVPGDVEIANLVGDTQPDLVLTYPAAAFYSVLPNQGGATFGPAVDHSAPEPIQSFELGAVGTSSLFMVTMSSMLWFWTPDGAGGFSRTSGIGVAPVVDFLLTELAGGGGPEVVAAKGAAQSKGASVWLFDGLPYSNEELQSGGSLFPVLQLAAGDLDGDGRPDLVWPGVTVPSVIVSMGRGDGRFGAIPSLPDFTGNITAVAAGDFDNDGKPDVALDNNLDLRVMHYPLQHEYDAGSILTVGRPYTWLSAGRFDPDGNLDLVGLTNTLPLKLSQLNGNGDLTLDGPVDFVVGAGARRPTVVDLDGDGKLDVVVPCKDANRLDVLLQGPTGLLTPVAQPTQPGPIAVRYRDLDGDGDLDRVTACTGQLVVEKSDGAGGYGPPWSIAEPTDVLDLDLGDIDEDGAADALVCPATAYDPPLLHVFKGHGDGTFGEEQVLDMDFWSLNANVANCQLNELRLVDLDEDGHLDALFRDGARTAVIFSHGHGDGTFGAPEADAALTTANGMALADFDGDGHLDVLIGGNRSTNSAVTILRNRTGTGVTGVPAPPATIRIGLAITQVTPQPARGRVALTIESEAAGAVRLLVHTIGGRIVRELPEVTLVAGTNRVPLDTSGLASGVYWLRALRGGTSAARKVVVESR